MNLKKIDSWGGIEMTRDFNHKSGANTKLYLQNNCVKHIKNRFKIADFLYSLVSPRL